MKAIVTSDTLNEVCKTDTAHLSNGFSEVVECNKAYVNEDRFTAISSNLVDGNVIDLQKLIDDAVKKAIDALIGEGTDGLPDDVIQVIDDKINNNPEIVNITQKIEDGIKQIIGDIEDIGDGTIAGELDKYDKILAKVGTTLDGDGNEVEGLKAQVSEHAVAYNTINEEVNRSGAMYTLDVTAGGAVAGFTAAAYEDTNGKSISEFIVEADKFLVARGIDDDGNIVGTPAFAIDGNNIAMNGRVSFTNLTNGNGETVIDGGLITTDEVRIANSLVVGSTIAPINYGKFPVTVDDTEYLTPDNDYIDKAILKKILPIGTHLQFGDKYSDDTNEYEYVFEGGGSWKSVQKIASDDATAKVNAAKQDATAKANSAEQAAKDALAQNIGYTDYDNMVSVAKDKGKIVAEGGFLNVNVIDADAIFAKDISASGTITGATLKGCKIIGQKYEIVSSTDNSKTCPPTLLEHKEGMQYSNGFGHGHTTDSSIVSFVTFVAPSGGSSGYNSLRISNTSKSVFSIEILGGFYYSQTDNEADTNTIKVSTTIVYKLDEGSWKELDNIISPNLFSTRYVGVIDESYNSSLELGVKFLADAEIESDSLSSNANVSDCRAYAQVING